MAKKQAKKSSKFGIGLAIGAAAGAVAGVLLAPKSGKQTRAELKKKAKELEKYVREHDVDKKVTEIFGAASAEAKRTFTGARRDLMERVSELDLSRGLDRRKFEATVKDVVSGVQAHAKAPLAVADRLKREFNGYFEKLMTGAKKKAPQKAKKAVKKAVRTASKSPRKNPTSSR